MPNNGIVSTKTNIPDKFRSNNPTEFDNTTDMVVINKALDGINVTQKSVTLNQLAGLVGGGEAGPQGPMGPQGPAGPTSPAGLDWKGAYNNSLAYELNDVVTWTNPDTDVLGSYWVTETEGVTGVAPTNNSGVINAGWAFLASQGPQGIQGVQGIQGEVGPQGPAVSIGYKSIVLKIRTTDGGNFFSPPVFTVINAIYNDSGLTYSIGSSQINNSESTQCIVPINFSTTFNVAKIYATGISNSAADPLDIIASVADNDTINYHIKQMDDPDTPIVVPINFQFSVEIRIYN